MKYNLPFVSKTFLLTFIFTIFLIIVSVFIYKITHKKIPGGLNTELVSISPCNSKEKCAIPLNEQSEPTFWQTDPSSIWKKRYDQNLLFANLSDASNDLQLGTIRVDKLFPGTLYLLNNYIIFEKVSAPNYTEGWGDLFVYDLTNKKIITINDLLGNRLINEISDKLNYFDSEMYNQAPDRNVETAFHLQYVTASNNALLFLSISGSKQIFKVDVEKKKLTTLKLQNELNEISHVGNQFLILSETMTPYLEQENVPSNPNSNCNFDRMIYKLDDNFNLIGSKSFPFSCKNATAFYKDRGAFYYLEISGDYGVISPSSAKRIYKINPDNLRIELLGDLTKFNNGNEMEIVTIIDENNLIIQNQSGGKVFMYNLATKGNKILYNRGFETENRQDVPTIYLLQNSNCLVVDASDNINGTTIQSTRFTFDKNWDKLPESNDCKGFPEELAALHQKYRSQKYLEELQKQLTLKYGQIRLVPITINN